MAQNQDSRGCDSAQVPEGGSEKAVVVENDEKEELVRAIGRVKLVVRSSYSRKMARYPEYQGHGPLTLRPLRGMIRPTAKGGYLDRLA